MQFASKTQHSTALCSVVYLETLQYYIQNGSQVFSCLLNARKAFDRIHYGKLFNMLIDKNCHLSLFVFCFIITVDNNLELCGIHVIQITSACQPGKTR